MKPYLPDEIANPTDRPGIAQYLLNMQDRRGEEDYLAPTCLSQCSTVDTGQLRKSTVLPLD